MKPLFTRRYSGSNSDDERLVRSSDEGELTRPSLIFGKKPSDEVVHPSVTYVPKTGDSWRRPNVTAFFRAPRWSSEARTNDDYFI